jgi:uncharacterized caspase-like protein
VRRLIPLLILLAGCATVAGGDLPDGQRDKGFSASRSTREALDATFAPRRIALVVGVGTYDDPAFPALRWAERDAQEVGRILGDPDYGGFDRVVRLSAPEDVGRDRILAELVSLQRDLRRQDMLVVYVSSHGTMTLDSQGEPHLYLVARDTRPSDLRGTAVELDELQRFFSGIRAERKALILDACYNGEAKSTLQPTVRQRVERLDEAPTLSRKVRLGEAEAHLFASTFGRPAREDDSLQHGVYTYHLLDALTWSQQEADSNRDGVVTVYEAHDFARARTVAYTDGVQVPEAYFRMVGHNDLVLAGNVDARRASAEGTLFWYGPAADAWDGAAVFVDGQEKGLLPGAWPVDAGRHHVRVVGRDGALLQDRTIFVAASDPIALEAVQERPRSYSGFLSVQPKVRVGLTDALLPLVGRVHVGAEAEGGYRFLGAARGLTLGGGVGYAPHQARFVDGDDVSLQPRHAIWGEAGIGYRFALPRGELGVGYRARVTGLTALEGPGCLHLPACDAWIWGTHGVQVDEMIALGPRFRLRFEQELGVTALDPLGEGAAPGIDASFSIGLEVGL